MPKLQTRRRQCVVLGLMLAGSSALGGCAAPAARLGVAGAGRELTRVPFNPQTQYHCGPAALATVLTDAGVAAQPDAVAPLIYVPGRHGSLQAEVAAAARRFGLVAYPVAQRLDALTREVDAGRPVLVLQNLSFALAPEWHYAVVVGHAPGEIILRSGTTRRLVLPRRLFDRTWAGAGRWGLVMLSPGTLPAEVNRDTYVRAVAPLARIGSHAAAEQAWLAALTLWPKDLTALVGLGNARHGNGDLNGAIVALRTAVDAHPTSAPAHNNLAWLLNQAGQSSAALPHARRAVELGGRDLPTYQETLREVMAGATG